MDRGVELPGVVAKAVQEIGEVNAPGVMVLMLGVWARGDDALWAGMVLAVCGQRPVREAARFSEVERSALGRSVAGFREACRHVGLGLVERAIRGEERAEG